ncbi:hypothetical protein CSPX01_02961, partial [Colletotrichum filicis]
ASLSLSQPLSLSLSHTHTLTLTLTRLSPLNPPLLERHLTHCLARSFPSRLTRRSPRLDLRLVLSSLSQLPRCSVVGQSSLAHQHCHLGLFFVISLKRKGATHTLRQQRTHSGEVVAAYISELSSSRPTAQSWNPPPVLQHLLDSSPELETVGIILRHLLYFSTCVSGIPQLLQRFLSNPYASVAACP